MGPTTAPYGTWSSPITAEAITKGANSIADVIVDRVTSEVYHIESRPSEAGRNVLVHTGSNRDVVGPAWNVRTSAQEYGGAPAIVHNAVAYFSNLSDGRIYRVKEGGEPEAVSPEEKPYRYACFEPHPNHPHLLLSVLEDHTTDIPSEIVTTLVVVNTDTKTIHPLLSGADFYALPKFSPNGNRLAWQQWYHPDMPWEGGEVHIADVLVDADGTISVSNNVHVAGVRGEIGAGYPAWANNDNLIFTSDESGYTNPWKYGNGKASPLFPEPVAEDFAHPYWVFHYSPYAILDQGGKTGLWNAVKDGRDVLYLVDLNGGSMPKPVESPFVVVEVMRTVSFETQEVVFIGQKTNEKESIVQCSLTSLTNLDLKVLKGAAAAKVGSAGGDLPRELISEPQPITLKVPPTDAPLHVVYYPPHNPSYSGSSIEGEKPPCIVNVHGGPTGFTTQGLNWGKQYFTSRGWAWLDVNYGGSSGYGRQYIERLVGKWGVVDVQDCITAAKTLSSSSYDLIDSKRLFIRGGSAGGFTVLATLSTASDLSVFAAATSLYGVSDLQKLSEFTHKFESRYLDKLVGGTYEEVPDVYNARSPIYHADNIVSPLLILQGEIDMVVPKDQAESIYNSIKDRGGVVEYKLYPGEGHGWRQEANMRDSLERELGFYERVLGLKK
ncbi:alpha/beta-hydrolase [Crassisporium funariophilum]|nr:alpha/beta-hydrolase [Crassisporium funariophilum]